MIETKPRIKRGNRGQLFRETYSIFVRGPLQLFHSLIYGFLVFSLNLYYSLQFSSMFSPNISNQGTRFEHFHVSIKLTHPSTTDCLHLYFHL